MHSRIMDRMIFEFLAGLNKCLCRLSERQDERPCCKEQERNRYVLELLTTFHCTVQPRYFNNVGCILQCRRAAIVPMCLLT